MSARYISQAELAARVEALGKVTCEHCGTEFTRRSPWGRPPRFCSRTCQVRGLCIRTPSRQGKATA